MESGEWSVVSGEWSVQSQWTGNMVSVVTVDREHGEWRIESAEWRVERRECGLLIVYCELAIVGSVQTGGMF